MGNQSPDIRYSDNNSSPKSLAFDSGLDIFDIRAPLRSKVRIKFLLQPCIEPGLHITDSLLNLPIIAVFRSIDI